MKGKLFKFLLDRIERSHPMPAIFTRMEIGEWSEASLDRLLATGFVTETGRLKMLACDGCVEGCRKPVVVRTTSDRRTKIAYINCDEQPNHGRIPVALDDLTGYQSSLRHLAKFIARECDLEVDEDIAENLARLGKVKGRYGWRDVSVAVGLGAMFKLKVGSHEDDLDRLLSDRAGLVIVDAAHVRRMANRKEAANVQVAPAYPGERSKQAQRTQSKAARDRKILSEAERLRRSGMSWPEASRQIAKLDFIQNEPEQKAPITAATIRRIIARKLST